ncbi:MAG: hypothetical protein ACI8RD_014597, partial [Bacillariaceae sp.]
NQNRTEQNRTEVFRRYMTAQRKYHGLEHTRCQGEAGE